MPDAAPPTIAWLMDVHGDDAAQHAHAARHLAAWARRLGATIQPVYGLRERQALAATGRDATREDVLAATRARISELMHEYDLPADGEPLVVAPIEEEDLSLEELATRCGTAVRKAEPILTFVHTHRRSTVGRLFIGSFAEELLAHLPGPLLVVNPYAGDPLPFNSLTYATDFSDGSRAGFEALLPIAAALDVPVTLDNHRTLQTLSVFMSGDLSRSQQRAEAQALSERSAKAAAALTERADAAGVAVAYDVREGRGSAQAADAIMRRAKQRGDVAIALAARSREGGVRFGGMTRTLMRRADRPVLVLPIDGER